MPRIKSADSKMKFTLCFGVIPLTISYLKLYVSIITFIQFTFIRKLVQVLFTMAMGLPLEDFSEALNILTFNNPSPSLPIYTAYNSFLSAERFKVPTLKVKGVT